MPVRSHQDFYSCIARGGTLFLILQAELQLVEVKLLRARTVAMTQHALEQQPQLLILGQQLRDHLPQHLLQGRGVVRERRKIDLHTGMVRRVPASPPMIPS